MALYMRAPASMGSNQEVHMQKNRKQQPNGQGGVLTRFVELESQKWAEHPRTRVPDGVGGALVRFSANKFKAVCLEALTSMSHVQVAEGAGVSYEMLRHWALEPRFREEMEAVRAAFAEHFIEHVRALEAVAGRVRPSEAELEDVYVDATLYGFEVLEGIFQRNQQPIEGRPRERLFAQSSVLLYVGEILHRQLRHLGVAKFGPQRAALMVVSSSEMNRVMSQIIVAIQDEQEEKEREKAKWISES